MGVALARGPSDELLTPARSQFLEFVNLEKVLGIFRNRKRF